MRVLAFDCALDDRSAALFEDGTLVAARRECGARQHAERLLALFGETLNEAGWRYEELDLICLTHGPGSFTGLRIGLAAARGLALALELPVLGLTTLEALAAGIEAEPRPAALALIDARRNQLYAQPFAADGGTLAKPQACAPEALPALAPPGPLALVGSGAALARPHLGDRALVETDAPALPDAARFGRLAWKRAGSARRDAPPAPLYLRPPDAMPAAARR